MGFVAGPFDGDGRDFAELKLAFGLQMFQGMAIGLAIFTQHAARGLAAACVALRRLADRLELASVQCAVEQGWSWTQVAEALGVTRQAAHKRHARRVRVETNRRDGT